MTVVDASLVVRLLLNRSGDAALRDRVSADRVLHAPTLVDAEVTSAVRGLLLAPRRTVGIDRQRPEEMLADFDALPLLRYPCQPLQRRVLDLRHNLTAYDGFYVALAEALDLPLLTDDGKFVGAAGHTARIETWV